MQRLKLDQCKGWGYLNPLDYLFKFFTNERKKLHAKTTNMKIGIFFFSYLGIFWQLTREIRGWAIKEDIVSSLN